MLDPAAPQLVVEQPHAATSAGCRRIRTRSPRWSRPGCAPDPDRQVFLNQYVVEDETQTSGFGAYSLTYLGVSLAGVDAPGRAQRGRLVDPLRRVQPAGPRSTPARGAPRPSTAAPRIEVAGQALLAETEADGVPLIRARCRVGETGHVISSGHHRYFTRRDGQLLSSVYPFVAEPVAPFEIESVEFLRPRHPMLRAAPGEPAARSAWGTTRRVSSFAYPVG